MQSPAESESKQSDLLGAALYEDDYDTLAQKVASSGYKTDPVVLLACIWSIGHMARRFGQYPKRLKDDLWACADAYQDEFGTKAAQHDVLEVIRHFGPKAD